MTDVTGAVVDRRAIDWDAVLARVPTSRDRALLESLRFIDRASETAAPSPRPTPIPRTPRIVRPLIALAAAQTAACLTAVALAFANGEGTSGRTSQVIVAASFAASSVLLGLRSASDARSLLLLAAFTAAASAFARAPAGVLPPEYSAWTAPLARGLYPESFIPACLWQFALGFPAGPRFTAFDLLARRATIVAWTIGAALFGVNVLAERLRVEPGVAGALLRNDPGNAFWTVFALLAVPAILAVVARGRSGRRTDRRALARLAQAIAVGAGPLLVCGLARAALPGFDRWLLAAGPAERAWIDNVILTGLALMPVMGAIAIVVDRTLRPHPLFRSTRSRLRDTLELRGFGRGSADRDRLVSAMERINRARGPRETAAQLAGELHDGVGATRVRVLSAVSDGPFRDADGTITLARESAIGSLLTSASRPIDLSPDGSVFRLLPRHDRGWLATHDIELAAPVRHADGAVPAIVLIGGQPADRPFTKRDAWLVAALTAAAAAVWTIDPADPSGEPAWECGACGRVADGRPLPCECAKPPALAALPHHISGKFVVERRLGAGGMGVVYLARDTSLDRPVALKTLPDLSDRSVARLREEARAMARLNHSSLATLYGLEVWRRTPILVVEYLPGGTLARRIANGPFSRAAVVSLGLSVAGAMEYMHGHGVLHRDVKPSNIAFTAAGAPKLLDFGLVAVGDSLAGTPAYLPPEAFRDAAPGPAFDLWALALTLREAAGNEAGSALTAFFERALALDRADRYQSAAEMRSALESLSAAADRRD